MILFADCQTGIIARNGVVLVDYFSGFKSLTAGVELYIRICSQTN